MKDILGSEVAIGDLVACAVTQYRSGKLTLAYIQEVHDGSYPRVTLKTYPGNRKTAAREGQVLLVQVAGRLPQ